MLLTDLTGTASIVFSSTALLLRLPLMASLSSARRIVLAGLIYVLLMMPFAGVSIIEFIRGMIGDLSITSLLLIVMTIRKPAPSIKSETLLLITLSGCALYVLALGFSTFDLYRLGFGNLGVIVGLLIVAILAWWRNNLVLAAGVSLAVIAWSIGYYESTNLWDYLLDPLLFIYALSAIIYRLLSRKIF